MNIIKKLRFVIVLISLSVCLCFMSTTYSKYVADATGDIEILFAKWQILVNNVDITGETESNVVFVPTIEESEYVAANTIAPTTKGYFDINIDPSNVDVSFKYTINLDILNDNMPDLMITKYAIIPQDYIEGDALDLVNLETPEITNKLNYDKNTENFKFEPITIRIFFEWFDEEGQIMTDEDDSNIGYKAAVEDTKFKMTANITFEQIIE